MLLHRTSSSFLFSSQVKNIPWMNEWAVTSLSGCPSAWSTLEIRAADAPARSITSDALRLRWILTRGGINKIAASLGRHGGLPSRSFGSSLQAAPDWWRPRKGFMRPMSEGPPRTFTCSDSCVWRQPPVWFAAEATLIHWNHFIYFPRLEVFPVIFFKANKNPHALSITHYFTKLPTPDCLLTGTWPLLSLLKLPEIVYLTDRELLFQQMACMKCPSGPVLLSSEQCIISPWTSCALYFETPKCLVLLPRGQICSRHK